MAIFRPQSILRSFRGLPTRIPGRFGHANNHGSSFRIAFRGVPPRRKGRAGLPVSSRIVFQSAPPSPAQCVVIPERLRLCPSPFGELRFSTTSKQGPNRKTKNPVSAWNMLSVWYTGDKLWVLSVPPCDQTATSRVRSRPVNHRDSFCRD